MKNANRRALIVMLWACMSCAQADFNDGVVAYLMGDYEKAIITMQSLAETSDHGYAQYYMGMMRLQGQGVKQDYEHAGRWFRKAAENRIPQAQYRLGELYMKGHGVPKDYEFAYIWFNTGAAHDHEKSIAAIAKARTKLSAEELIEADRLVEAYIKRYGPLDKEGRPGDEPGQPIPIQ